MRSAAGWGWAALLIGWFVASSALTRLGGPEKERRSRSSLAPASALLRGGPVAPGMSGGVTVVGLLGGVAGAPAVSVGAAFVHGRLTWPVLLAVATAGTCGALVDSALGGSLQSRRWCATCARFTERSIHDCGTATTHARGLRWMTNDTVNLIATAVGALVALALVAP